MTTTLGVIRCDISTATLDVPNEYRIRDARRSDVEAIGILWLELMTLHRNLDSRFTIAPDGQYRYARHALEVIRSRDARILVAEEVATGRLVGYVMGEILTRPVVSVPGTYGFISDISVTEEWRHKGVGSALFQDLRRWFVDRKVRAVELYVADVNPASMAFWTKMGLTPFLRLMHVDL